MIVKARRQLTPYKGKGRRKTIITSGRSRREILETASLLIARISAIRNQRAVQSGPQNFRYPYPAERAMDAL